MFFTEKRQELLAECRVDTVINEKVEAGSTEEERPGQEIDHWMNCG